MPDLLPSLRRLAAMIRRRMSRAERVISSGFAVRRGSDGYDYINPIPAGTLTMAKRRTR